jgi:RNA polymerase sigma-70 factor (ECF subfamily)
MSGGMHIPDLEARSDAELLRAFVAGDRDSLEVLLRRHEARVYGLAYRMLGNRADALDASQEVLVHLFRKAGSFKYQAAFTTWLYRLTVNACHDLARARKRAPVARAPQLVEEVHASNPSSLDQADDRMVIEEALRALPEEQRAAVVLRDLHGLAYDQIAQVLGVPVGTVKSRIARGRLALGARLKEPAVQPDRLSSEDR